MGNVDSGDVKDFTAIGDVVNTVKISASKTPGAVHAYMVALNRA